MDATGAVFLDQLKSFQAHDAVHIYADTDQGQAAIHHTLGPGPGQAAEGTHIHAGQLNNAVVKNLNPGTFGTPLNITTSLTLIAGSTNADGTIKKKYAKSDIYVQCHLSAFANTVNILMDVYFRPDAAIGSQTIVQRQFFNETATHTSWSGLTMISGLPVGTHNFQFYGITNSGTCTMDTNDGFSYLVAEIVR